MKTQKGITLIALIITIIVMLILVGVSVSVALNTGLFKAAQGAAKDTEAARINETKLSNGKVILKNSTTGNLEEVEINSFAGTKEEKMFNHTDANENGVLDRWEVVTHIATGDEFYILETNATEVVLFSKYNLKKVGDALTTEQDKTGGNNYIDFASSAYWWDEATNSYTTEDLNDITKVPEGETAYALEAARSYAHKITGNAENGRLLLDSEVDLVTPEENLPSDNISFWMATPNSDYVFCSEYGLGQGMQTSSFGYNDNSYNQGVNPVVTVPLASI